MPETTPNTLAAEIDRVNADVTGIGHVGQAKLDPESLPQRTAAALAAQSLAQSATIAVADATAALRDVETMMSTVQSVALTRWIEAGGEDQGYQQIVNAAAKVTADAVNLWREVNAAARELIDSLPEGGGVDRVQGLIPEPSPARPGTGAGKQAAKTRARKKTANKAAKARASKKAGKKAGKKTASKTSNSRAKGKDAETASPVAEAAG